jgi:putative NIF3 family GTP cyclohydrolase 1 type 2
MELLSSIQEKLDSFFNINLLEKDPAFSRFVPAVYDPIQYDWKNNFESDFVNRFNGLMLRGADEVNTVFLAVFPTNEVITKFLDEASEGDLLFMHHPIPMECGDPRGKWGRGFVPIELDLLSKLKERRLSVYTCHAPLDYNRIVGTSDAIAEALGATIIDEFTPYGLGNAGLICDIPISSTKELVNNLRELFEIPYIDFEGVVHKEINRVAIIAGCGDVVAEMQNAEGKGAQAYITGEIHCHIDNDYGREKYAAMMEYVMDTKMSLIGVSHAASEFLVMKTQLKNWFMKEFNITIKLLRQDKWWE